MKIHSTKNAYCTRLKMDGELTIYHAAAVKAELVQHLTENLAEEIEIDLSFVVDFDSAGLQLLLLAKRESVRQGSSLKLVGHSPCVLEVFELLNIGAYFGDPLLFSESDNRVAEQHREIR